MNIKILVADDDKHIGDLLVTFLTNFGYLVDLANNVRSAMTLLKKNTYDIILTDKNMPDDQGNTESGMTLLKYAKENAPSSEVIMITGYATVETAVEAMKAGAFDYIMKPVRLDDLKEKIDRILEYKQFVNSENTLQIYRTLYSQVLSLLKDKHDLSEDQIQRMLKTLGSRIDHVFGMQKEYETIIQAQAEAMEKIEVFAKHLLDALQEESPYYPLVEKIVKESKKRI
ncbi:response regulator [Thermodesulfobacteriota bacterium]